MTKFNVVGLIVMLLIIGGLIVSIAGHGNATGYKIQILIQSSAFVLTIYELALRVNLGRTIASTIILLIAILINLILNIVYLVR